MFSPRKAILIRVAVDQTFGRWNAPCNPATGEFVYVPIPQDRANAPGMARGYHAIVGPALEEFSRRNATDVRLPAWLRDSRMHLDPDFDHLTYGDTVTRGRRLTSFEKHDLVVFYSGLRPIQGSGLIYALIGVLVVDRVRRVADIAESEYEHNAHTRLLERSGSDIVVVGKPGVSGRFSRYIDIGERRDNSYRVRRDLLEAWGGLTVKDGWIQRSANPPLFLDPARFGDWLASRTLTLLAANNPDSAVPRIKS